MSIVVIDYKGGNTRSVLNALNKLNINATLSANTNVISKASKVIFPGVGEAKTAMDSLNNSNLVDCIKELKIPVLGICLGLQLLYKETEERNAKCLNIIDDKILKFNLKEKIPHMGWNKINDTKTDIFKDLDKKDYLYFVHSFYAPISTYTIATSSYGNFKFSAAVKKDNFYAVQFHPEKSGVVGSKILKNFLNI